MFDIKTVLSKGTKLNTEYRRVEATSRKRVRFNLLLFKKLCFELCEILPDEVISHSSYLFAVAEPITQDRYPNVEILDLQPEDPSIAEYIQKGKRSGEAVLPELDSLLKEISFGLQISPFDVLCYQSWNATPQSLFEFLYSAKDGTRRGKQTTKKTIIANNIECLDTCEKLKKRYFDLVFQNPLGYGSGMPTYDWAATLTGLVDNILLNSPELMQLCEASALQREHIELGIHQYFIEQCSKKARQQAMVLGKELLYNSSICEIAIEDD